MVIVCASGMPNYTYSSVPLSGGPIWPGDVVMSSLEKTLVTFFEQVANQDTSVMHALERDLRFRITADRWRFTLPDLFSFMSQWCDSLRSCTYPQFRRGVYNSPINAAVKKLGAEIIIDTNHRNTDKSVYALVWYVESTADVQTAQRLSW